jgi:hypothetical protein
MWDMKWFVIPVINGATGVPTKCLNNTRKAFSRFFAKRTVLGISHIKMKELESETEA